MIAQYFCQCNGGSGMEVEKKGWGERKTDTFCVALFCENLKCLQNNVVTSRHQTDF